MNRTEFMRQLESLLGTIPEQERSEALQYYNDYFDDAGSENEQSVITALGNPARVAENIKRELTGNACLQDYERSAVEPGKELVRYGETLEALNPEEAQRSEHVSQFGQAGASGGASRFGQAGAFGSASQFGQAGTPGGTSQFVQADARPGTVQSDTAGRSGSYDGSGQPGKSGKGLPTWAIVLIVLVCVFGSPVILGLATSALGLILGAVGTVIGLLFMWFGLILGFGLAAVVCLIMGVVLGIVGGAGMIWNPLAGLGVLGIGLLVAACGLLFMILTVGMAGWATPGIFKGIAWILRAIFGKKKKGAV